jgi:glycerophosphoryl diester phosphodiesterase
MNTIKFDNKGKVKMVAHRGASCLERENTCPAFVAAGVKSYFGIETDVQVTLDEKYIIVHDVDLRRMAGIDMGVMTSNFDDLRAVRFTDVDGLTPRGDIFLPSLEEYLSICKKYGKKCVYIVLNIKILIIYVIILMKLEVLLWQNGLKNYLNQTKNKKK